MPQMAPMSWLYLFITFTMIFIMFNYLNYFVFMKTTTNKKSMTMKSLKSLNWKW
uniref:ATP synthase complex subunit 8 n=1 Tax=Contacyphon sp. BT0012 TaxID=546486 RepID=B6D8T4_9COLE|nr:ATP synthase F0 subunit 8 [Contacyphon sp. BT0012]ACF35072.1 ATP synthase F0 subunit 8 [Contacyphon sp. BT0012]